MTDKVIDAFLFFQELDLLEIRLSYLDPYVDQFVILEASQTFSGRVKPFVFEQNVARYSKFLPKIVYFKLDDFHENVHSVETHLESCGTQTHETILRILRAHKHYPRDALNWVLDSYHRESLHLPLSEVARSSDLVIVSDLDEIPSEKIFLDGTIKGARDRPRVCRQHECRYFLNLYKDSDWSGSIVARYGNIKGTSLNLLRIDSKSAREVVSADVIAQGGWHFTSCGGLESIRNKIKSWGHQELNTARVIKQLEYNIRTGQDIFEREHGTNLRKIDIEDRTYFDTRFAEIARNYPHLLMQGDVERVERSAIREWAARARRAIGKIAQRAAEYKRGAL